MSTDVLKLVLEGFENAFNGQFPDTATYEKTFFGRLTKQAKKQKSAKKYGEKLIAEMQMILADHTALTEAEESRYENALKALNTSGPTHEKLML